MPTPNIIAKYKSENVMGSVYIKQNTIPLNSFF